MLEFRKIFYVIFCCSTVVLHLSNSANIPNVNENLHNNGTIIAYNSDNFSEIRILDDNENETSTVETIDDDSYASVQEVKNLGVKLPNQGTIRTNVPGIKDVTLSTPTIDSNIDQNYHPIASDRRKLSDNNKRTWYDDVKLFPIVFARSLQEKMSFCGQDSKKFLNDLANFKLWAVQMYDASSKIPSGVWDGAIFDFGNFHKCASINAYANEETIKGKFCFIEIQAKLKNSTQLKQDPFTRNYDPLGSAWELIQYQGDTRKIRRDTLTWALCMPSSCDENDILNGISADAYAIPDRDNIEISIQMSRYGCSVKDESNLSSGDKMFLTLSIGILTLIFVSTIWLYKENKNAKCELKIVTLWQKIAKSFSIIENFNSLTKYRHTKPCFTVLHGVKFLCMGLVIHGHRLLQYFGKPVFNNYALEETYIQKRYMIIHNGLIILDAFFLMTGFIMAYGYLESFAIRKSKFWLVPYSIALRFLRLIPAYMYVVFFIITVWTKLGSGPFWNTLAMVEAEKCSQTWWASLLLINNYVEPENMCMMTTWYLSSDFHMFVIGSIIMYIISKNVKVGYLVLALCLIISLCIPFLIIYKDATYPILTIFPGLTDVRENKFFTNYYVKTHMRMFPYLFGLVAGIIYYKIRDTKFKMSTGLSVILFIVFEIITTFVCELSGDIFFMPDRELNPLESAVYFVIQHTVFTICTALMIFVVSHTEASFFSTILGNKFFAILSKLTFGAYLIHYLVQTYDVAIQITPIAFTFTTWLSDLLMDLIVSYFLAFILFLTVEAPMKMLTGLILKGK